MNLDFEKVVEFIIVPRPRKNGEGFKDSLFHQLNSLWGTLLALRKLREVNSVISDGPGLCLSVFGAYYFLTVRSDLIPAFLHAETPQDVLR